jgi:hypothetical protein
VVDELVTYDRPDIILLLDGRPVLVVEKTREVPTGHNVGQRVARLVRAVEEGIPTLAFFPFDARKHGTYTNICNLNIRLLKAFERMTEIHSTPILAVNWGCDEHGELIDDGSENRYIAMIVNDFLASGLRPDCHEIKRQIKIMEDEYRARLVRYPKYGQSPGDSLTFMSTLDLLREVDGVLPRSAHATLSGRRESAVYTIKMTPGNCRREDPYTGTQFIYDYLWCRSGPKPEDKHSNLVLRFPLIDRRRWHEANPNDRSRKSCNWYLTANAMWFSDGLEVLR